MKSIQYTTLFVSLFFVGCASVPQADSTLSQKVKELKAPSEGQAAVYVYRSKSVVGAALKKDVWLDGACLGETARGTFFYKEVMGDQEHVISTESEFSPNHLKLKTDAGKSYFIQQYIKPGAFVGGANLKQVSDEEGRKAVNEYSLAKGGDCSKPSIILENK